MWHCVSNDGEGKDADGIRKKPIDKSHKKRYILFINALKKSVHRLEPHREPGAAENPAGYRRGTVTLEQKR